MKSSKAPPPRHLSVKAKAWWRRLVNEWVLDDAGLLILQAGLEALDRMIEAQAILKVDGSITEDRFGQKKQHPATLVERDSRSAMLAALKQLHLDLEPAGGLGRPPGK